MADENPMLDPENPNRLTDPGLPYFREWVEMLLKKIDGERYGDGKRPDTIELDPEKVAKMLHRVATRLTVAEIGVLEHAVEILGSEIHGALLAGALGRRRGGVVVIDLQDLFRGES